MSKTNEDIIKSVNAWQTAGFVHPLTCANDSGHRPLLKAVEEDGVVVLKCEVCNYTQKHIPDIVKDATPEVIEAEKERLRDLGFKL